MTADDELFEITLMRVERSLEMKDGEAIYDCEFDCVRTSAIVQITISLDAAIVTTREIVPLAMSEMHRAFLALAEQTRAWRIEPG